MKNLLLIFALTLLVVGCTKTEVQPTQPVTYSKVDVTLSKMLTKEKYKVLHAQKSTLRKTVLMVYSITEAQADSLRMQEFAPDQYYWPVQDCNGNWLITEEEVSQTVFSQWLWVKNLPQMEYCEPV